MLFSRMVLAQKRKKERKNGSVAHSPSLYLDQFDVVCRQHSGEAGPLDASGHPAGVDRVDLDDEVALGEAHLVTVLGLVVVDCTVDAHFAHWFRGWSRCWGTVLLGWLNVL